MDKLLTPHPPNPASEPVGTLERAGRALKILDEQIRSKGVEMGRLGVQFSKAKQELQTLLKQRAGLLKDEDAALEALRREDDQVTSASSSSHPVTQSAKKRPLPTGLVPQEKKKKLAATPIWPKSAQTKSARHDGDH